MKSVLRTSAELSLLATLMLPVASHAATFTVGDTFDGTGGTDVIPGDGICADSIGMCTLRAAIQESNALAGSDTIEFSIAGTIAVSSVLSALPQITDQLDIDGTSAPGYAGSSINLQDAPPVIYIDGSAVGGSTGSAAGLRYLSGGSFGSVRAIGITRFETGINIGSSASNVFVDASYIGLLADGTAAGNSIGISIGGSNNIIGRFIGGFGNVISANTVTGVNLAGSTGNFIGGNRIGTRPNGINARGNGVGVAGFLANGNFIGAFNDSLNLGNIIAGNTNEGILIAGSSNEIVANRIGIGANGFAIGNGGAGVSLLGDNNIVGSAATNGGNRITRNTDGVVVNGDDNEIAGNTIGVAGIGALTSGNSGDGIRVADGVDNRVLANRIYNSSGDAIDSLGSNTIIQSNFIGFALFPSSDVNYGNGGEGIVVRAQGNTIGGSTKVLGNVIGFSTLNGIRIESSGNRIENNSVGVAESGEDIGNGAEGMRLGSISQTVTANLVRNNTIAYNSLAGVGLASVAGAGNSIIANSTFDNGLIGIDLGLNGVTVNDAGDGDTGPNKLQNYPQILSVSFNDAASPPEVTVQWLVDSGSGTSIYPIVADFYLADSGESGEGRIHLGIDVVGVPNGAESVTLQLPAGTSGGHLVATSTDDGATLEGSTSEFSPPVAFGMPDLIFRDGFESP